MKVILLHSVTILFFSCSQPTGERPFDQNKDTPEHPVPVESFYAGDLFTLPDAEKILGEPAHLQDSSSYTTTDTSFTFQNSFSANAAETTSEKTGVIYFLYMDFVSVDLADADYDFIKTANEPNGIKVREDLGDEAYFHTDDENFYFMMVRKGDKSFRLKVNKITGNTSRDEFENISKKITDAI